MYLFTISVTELGVIIHFLIEISQQFLLTTCNLKLLKHNEYFLGKQMFHNVEM